MDSGLFSTFAGLRCFADLGFTLDQIGIKDVAYWRMGRCLVRHWKPIRRAHAKLLSPPLDWHARTCLAGSRVLSSHIQEILISGYEKRLSRVLRMRHPHNGGIIDVAAEGGKDLVIQPENSKFTIPPALAVRLIYR